jgi:hypothetical protein
VIEATVVGVVPRVPGEALDDRTADAFRPRPRLHNARVAPGRIWVTPQRRPGAVAGFDHDRQPTAAGPLDRLQHLGDDRTGQPLVA